jgi:hypothetical protein
MACRFGVRLAKRVINRALSQIVVSPVGEATASALVARWRLIVLRRNGRGAGLAVAGTGLLEAARSTGDPIAVLLSVFHMLWSDMLQADLADGPLSDSTLVRAAGDARRRPPGRQRSGQGTRSGLAIRLLRSWP